MKILVIVDFWSYRVYTKGMGAVYQLCNEIAKKGVEVHVLSALRIFDGKFGKDLPNPKKEGKLLIHFFDLRWLPINGIFYLAVSRILYFFYSVKLHLIYKFDVIHDYSSTPFSFISAIFYSLLKIKKIVTVCTKSRMNFFDSKFLWNKAKFENKVILTSEYYFRNVNKLTDSKGKIIYTSLGVKENYCLPVFKKTAKMKIFYIGADGKRKGSDLFFKAAGRLSDYKFVWITLKTANKPRNVTVIEGIVDLSKYISRGDICVLPYRNLEGVLFEPQTLLDVMSLGSAVVVSDFPQLKAIAKDSVCYFPAGNLDKMMEKIKYLSNSEKERFKLGRKAREIITKQFDRKKTVEEIIKIYKEVTNA